jgi:hypothetical protein
MTTRYLQSFRSLDGAVVLTFGLRGYSWQTDESFRVRLQQASGADFAVDPHGIAPAPLSTPTEMVGWLEVANSEAALESAIAAIRSKLLTIGQGWLYRVDSNGTQRRALARPRMLPSLRRSVGSQLVMPVSLEFLRLSHWQAITQTTGATTATSSPHTFTINNPGDLPCMAIEFTFTPNTAGPANDPVLENLTNGWSISTTRDLTATTQRLRIDSARLAIEYSTNSGGSWTSDWALASLGTMQAGMMRLEPGNNSMRITMGGSPNVTIAWTFYARYA